MKRAVGVWQVGQALKGSEVIQVPDKGWRHPVESLGGGRCASSSLSDFVDEAVSRSGQDWRGMEVFRRYGSEVMS